MLQKSRLGHMGGSPSLYRKIKPFTIWLGCFICFILFYYTFSTSTPAETNPSVIGSSKSLEEIQADARKFFERAEGERRARDTEEYAKQREILEKYKAEEANKQKNENSPDTTSSLLSLYTPTPMLVPAHLDLLTLSNHGVCIPKEACHKCPKDGGPTCELSGYRALFSCTAPANDTVDGTATQPTDGSLPVGAVSDVYIACEHAYVDGRQAFWAIMAVCAGGAVLAGACFKARLQRMFV